MAGKSNTSTVVPRLLRLLCLRDCIVTMDAMGYRKSDVRQIRDQGADHVSGISPTSKGTTTTCGTRGPWNGPSTSLADRTTLPKPLPRAVARWKSIAAEPLWTSLICPMPTRAGSGAT